MTKGPKMTLNLGCGREPKGNSVNHDRTKHSPYVEVAWDLNRLPWPWKDNTFEHIVAKAVLEHLDIDLRVSLDECWRILKPKGTVYVKVPWVGSEFSFDDPTHRWFFTLRSFNQFDPDTARGKEYANTYGVKLWRVLSVQYNKSEDPKDPKSSTSIIARLEVRK